MQKDVKGSLLKEAEMKIGSAIGFRHVIDLLSSEQKLIVGHNCFLGINNLLNFLLLTRLFDFSPLIFYLYQTDIAHVCKKFVGPLPSNLEDYVTVVQKNFPYIIDTKILLNSNDSLQLKMKKSSTSLANAFAILCPHIASGVGSSGLAHCSNIAVEVQVDDMRYAFPLGFILVIKSKLDKSSLWFGVSYGNDPPLGCYV